MYHNRDISWLGFNHRVLQEAADPAVPLMERVKFMSIFSSNMDEFFRVRYPVISIYSQLKDKTLNKIMPSPDPRLAEKVQDIISGQLEEFGTIMHEQILPDLAQQNIILYYNRELPEEFSSQIREIFFSRILAFIQPVFIEDVLEQEFFPENNKIYFFVRLKREGKDSLKHAIVNIPVDKLSRFFPLETDDTTQHIIFLDDIIRDNLSCIFTGFEIHSCYSFKITRDSELALSQESLGKDMVKEMEKQLARREIGKPTRFLFESGMPLSVQQFLSGALGLKTEELYEGGRYHNLSNLASLPVNRKDLEFSPMPQLKHVGLEYCGDIFRQIDEKDLLLHFPYQSYNPVLAFFNQAAIDPEVVSISVTLYRVAAESHIVNALISAARNKKRVQVFVELKARFDEANNIRWSKEMVKAGVQIIYSAPQVKVHSKIALVIRKTTKGEQGYAYVGTGNFNETTARFYTDHAIFTASNKVIDDLKHLFSILEQEKRPSKNAEKEFSHLLVSRFNMVNVFEQEILKQIKRHKKGKSALIRVKVNNLEDIYMIDLLYKAAAAGVPIRLLVRSICCIAPQAPSLSDSIEVRRIVGRFLEHSRIFIFGTGEETSIYMGSADWMARNLQQRIEVCIPVEEESAKMDLTHYFEIQWKDKVKAVWLDSELNQHRTGELEDREKPCAQEEIYQYLKTKQ